MIGMFCVSFTLDTLDKHTAFEYLIRSSWFNTRDAQFTDPESNEPELSSPVCKRIILKPVGRTPISHPQSTHLRHVLIFPYMKGVKIKVFSGKEFRPVVITTQMVGHYLGEYVITNKRVNHGAPGVGASRSSLYVPLK